MKDDNESSVAAMIPTLKSIVLNPWIGVRGRVIKRESRVSNHRYSLDDVDRPRL